MLQGNAGFVGRDAPSWLQAEFSPDVSDQQLLERFVAHRDEAAFVGLLQRHRRTVWGLCRRVLRQEQDAEDAFQSVFLTLSRSAGTIRKGTALGSWLYAVAFRIALRARQNEERRSAGEKKAPVPGDGPSPSAEAACRELQRKVDEELSRLPEKYRAPFVLCCLEGMSKAEAAKELGWKEGTVSGRLARARKLLQIRLARRGFKLSAIMTALALTRELASANPANALVQSTAVGVLTPESGPLSNGVHALADAARREQTPTRFAAALLAIAALILFLLGVGLIPFLLTSRGSVAPVVVVEPDTFLAPPVALGTPVDEQVLAVAFSPDAKHLATAGGQGKIPGQVKIWDAEAGEEIFKVAQQHGARTAAFAPDGKTIVTGDFRGAITVRDAKTLEEIASANAHAGGVSGLAFSQDGALLASAGFDNTAKVFAADVLQERKVLLGHTAKVIAIAFFKDGQSVITAGQDNTAIVWDINTGKERFRLAGHQAAIEAVAVSPDDKLVATASWDQTLRVWDTETGEAVAIFQAEKGNAFYAVAFSPDGKYFAAGGRDGIISLWDAGTFEPAGSLEKHKGPIWSLAFSRDGVLASGSADRTAKLWHLKSGKRPKDLVTSWSASRLILAAAYAPDGAVIAVATTDKTIHIRDAKSGDIIKVLHGHSAQVNSLAFSPDGKMLASGSDDFTVKVWDWSAGEEITTMNGHEGAVHALTFLAEGKQLASAADDKTIRVWDVGTGTEEFALVGHEAPLHALVVSADDRMLASGGADRTIKIWDLQHRTETRSLQGHEGAVRALAFSHGGVLASAGEDRTVRLWDPSTGAALRKLEGHTRGVRALAFTPLGTTLLSAGDDAAIRVWDPANGQSRGILKGHREAVTALTIHPHGLNLVSGSHDTVLFRWQAGKFRKANADKEAADPAKPAAQQILFAQPDKNEPGAEKAAPAEKVKADDDVRFVPPAQPFIAPVDEQVLTLAFSPDGKKVATAGAFWRQAGQLKIWNVLTAEELVWVRGIPGVRSIAWSPNGKTIASGDFSGCIRLRDADTGAEINAVKGHARPVNGVAYSFDGKWLVSAGIDNVAKLWTADDLQEQKEFVGHGDMVYSVAFFRHGNAFVTTSRDATAKIWDIASGKEKHTLRGHKEGVEMAAISPDDKIVATAGWDGTVRLWDADTGAAKGVLEGGPAGVLAIAFSPDGKSLASAGYDRTIHIWDVASEKRTATVGKHNSTIWALAFSKDGVLASGSSDSTARLWNVADNKQIALFPTSDRKPIPAIAYSPRGDLVALAKTGNTVQICAAKSGDLLHVLRGHTANVTCLAFSPTGDTLATGSADKTVIFWDPTTGKNMKTVTARPGTVAALAFTGDGKKVAIGCDDGSVQCCGSASGEELETLNPEAGPIRALAYASDGRLAIGGSDAAIKIRVPAKKEMFDTLTGHSGPIAGLVFSADGTLASAGDEGTIKIWQGNPAKERFTLKGHAGAARTLAFSRNGQTLVSGGIDGTVRTWDVAAGKATGTLRRHTDPVTVAIHPDCADVLSGGQDGQLLRWPRAASDFPTLPLIFRQDFLGTKVNLDFLKYTAKNPQKWIVPEAEGLRISPPETIPRPGPTGVSTNFRLKGDFDVIASYEILEAEIGGAGNPIGVSLWLTTDTPTEDAIMLARFNRQDGPFYTCSGIMTTPLGKKRQYPPGKLTFSEVMAGQLRLVRQGKVVRYLVAEEGAAGFQELRRIDLGTDDVLYVRLAVDPGNKESPPVVARLRAIEVRGRASAATEPAIVAPLAVPTQRTFGKEIYQDFRGKKPLIDELKLVGQDCDELCKPENEGLRITLPAERPDKQPVGVRLQFPLSGDFEITATYESLSSVPASGPGAWQAGVALNLSVANDYSKPFAKIGRFSLPQRGNRFVVETWNKEKPNQQFWKEYPAPSRTGKLRMVREGSTLSYQAADGPGDDFREIHKGEYSADDVAIVRFALAGHPVRVDARLIDLRIRYGAPIPADVPTPPARGTKERSGGWLAASLLIGGFLLALLVAVVGARWLFLRPRLASMEPAISVSQTPAAIAFACPACHKKLKAKPTLAGKKIKCPGCGSVASVPPGDAGGDDVPVV
jgi:RNA polymerase sigma factor (sigma-70 family)